MCVQIQLQLQLELTIKNEILGPNCADATPTETVVADYSKLIKINDILSKTCKKLTFLQNILQ